MVENEGTLFCSEMLFDGAPLESKRETDKNNNFEIFNQATFTFLIFMVDYFFSPLPSFSILP